MQTLSKVAPVIVRFGTAFITILKYFLFVSLLRPYFAPHKYVLFMLATFIVAKIQITDNTMAKNV